MKQAYQVLIHFGSPDEPIYVTGFIVPSAENKKNAIKQLKKSLLEHRHKFRKAPESLSNELSLRRINEFLWSLKRPHRINKRGDQLVKVLPIEKPILANYWLQEIGENFTLCNTR